MATIEPDEAASYDFTPLIDDFLRARSVVEFGSDGRYFQAAQSLCRFYTHLLDDVTFWEVAGRVADAPPPALEIVDQLIEFEVHEVQLLIRCGLPEHVAIELVNDLSRSLRQYRGELDVDVLEIRAGVETLAGHLCGVGPEVDDSERQLRRRLVVGRAQRIAGAALAAGCDIVTPPPFNVLSVAGSLIPIYYDLRDVIQRLDG
ncbi:MAG: hypothetical protein R2754_01725 [Microthrixaceae bacterium]